MHFWSLFSFWNNSSSIILATDDFSSKKWFQWKVVRIKTWNIVIGWSDTVWCYSLNNTLITIFFLLSIFRTILYYLTKYGFKGSQMHYFSKTVRRRFKHNEENVLKNAKNDLWNKAWQLTSSPLNLQTMN